ncbi:MAG: outer membrane beta-barrel protein [Deltaproteobacteria bacterium]|nr:outer membrane beta-barrel protein [Deltaproteobacteria bacterium]
MKKNLDVITAMLCAMCMVTAFAAPAIGDESENTGLRSDVEILKREMAGLKHQLSHGEKGSNRLVSALAGINLSGGISAGGFYASNPGKDVSDNDFLLSNFIVELSSGENDLPVSFTGAFGEVSTPSLLDAPENNIDFDIEYASVILPPFAGATLEAGLLQPNTGYEDTYTCNDKNAICSVTGSQQPYNAYGARVAYGFFGVTAYAGYYKTRLDNEEYSANGRFADNSWEIGATMNLAEGFDIGVYNYRINGLRNLTGAIFEYTLDNLYVAINTDYWRWDRSMKDYYGRRSASACALYVEPSAGRFSCPVRMEFVNQGKSMIYSDSTQAKRIYSASITPTWHFTENCYCRALSAYVCADGAFADHRGNVKNSRVYLAAETGFIF